MYVMVLKVYYFSFSAVAGCTFNWSMVNLLGKQRSIIWLTTPAIDCDWLKRKANMESVVLKCNLEGIMNGAWKEYEKYSVNLVMVNWVC